MSSPFYLKLGKISDEGTKQLVPSFTNLPENDYKDGEYRLRRFSAFTFGGEKVNKLPTRSFGQSGELNKFQGDVERQYEDIEASCYESNGFQEMFAQFYHNAGVPFDDEVEVHQLRIRARPNSTVEVAPEGVHQDGFNRIGMFIINHENLTGGELRVHETYDSKAMVEYLFKDGEFLVLNDAAFWHDANDIVAKDQEGYFDLFVITADKIAS